MFCGKSSYADIAALLNRVKGYRDEAGSAEDFFSDLCK